MEQKTGCSFLSLFLSLLFENNFTIKRVIANKRWQEANMAQYAFYCTGPLFVWFFLSGFSQKTEVRGFALCHYNRYAFQGFANLFDSWKEMIVTVKALARQMTPRVFSNPSVNTIMVK